MTNWPAPSAWQGSIDVGIETVLHGWTCGSAGRPGLIFIHNEEQT